MSAIIDHGYPLLFWTTPGNTTKPKEAGMKKITSASILSICLIFAGGSVIAASNKCRVVEAEGKKMVLECERDASQFTSGDQVKIKSVRTGAAVEGC
jgi:hypothetical protein